MQSNNFFNDNDQYVINFHNQIVEFSIEYGKDG